MAYRNRIWQRSGFKKDLEDSHVKNIYFVFVLKHVNVLAVLHDYPF